MKKNTISDLELIKKFVDGEQLAIETLITRHKERVYTYIYLMIKEHQLAEDIFQDTFIKVIKSLKRGKYQENGKFVSWVMRIAHNMIIDHFRKEKQMKMIANEEYEADIFNSQRFSDKNIEDHLVKEQIDKDVRKLVDELPDEQREVVLMRHYMGMSFQEISEQTGVSINTALGRMRYALINLRRFIEEKNLSLTAY